MSIEDRKRWDERHREPSGLKPRACVESFPPARGPRSLALDLACGQGRHAAALARLGYLVVAMDVSMHALRHALEASSGSAGRVLALQADADDWPFAPAAFDAVVQVDFLDRRLLPCLDASLASGGLLLVETFLDQGTPNREGPSSPAFLLSPGELPRAFEGYEILRYEEIRGETGRASMLARKR